MSRTKPYRSIVKVLKKNGWVLDHTTGSHEIYIKDGKICPVKCTKKRYTIWNFNKYRTYYRA